MLADRLDFAFCRYLLRAFRLVDASAMSRGATRKRSKEEKESKKTKGEDAEKEGKQTHEGKQPEVECAKSRDHGSVPPVLEERARVL